MSGFYLKINGSGNAWPVLLEEEHPFYDRHAFRELTNASFSILEKDMGGNILSEILIDAGQGVVQEILTTRNRIPDVVVITHPHLDHTASLDWISRSYYEKHETKKSLPVFCSGPCYRQITVSFPQLKHTIEHHELKPGQTVKLLPDGKISLTGFPLYHGDSAHGAMMMLFKLLNGRKVLITGDILIPLLREKDVEKLKGTDYLVTDANNRYPYPRSNHWSITSELPGISGNRSGLKELTDGLKIDRILAPHLFDEISEVSKCYFEEIREEFDAQTVPASAVEFSARIGAAHLLCVHYSGGEDEKYHDRKRLSYPELAEWVKKQILSEGLIIDSGLPRAGDEYSLE